MKEVITKAVKAVKPKAGSKPKETKKPVAKKETAAKLTPKQEQLMKSLAKRSSASLEREYKMIKNLNTVSMKERASFIKQVLSNVKKG